MSRPFTIVYSMPPVEDRPQTHPDIIARCEEMLDICTVIARESMECNNPRMAMAAATRVEQLSALLGELRRQQRVEELMGHSGGGNVFSEPMIRAAFRSDIKPLFPEQQRRIGDGRHDGG